MYTCVFTGRNIPTSPQILAQIYNKHKLRGKFENRSSDIFIPNAEYQVLSHNCKHLKLFLMNIFFYIKS